MTRADVLAELSERLVDLRVMPYYLHQLDQVAGAAHFHGRRDAGPAADRPAASAHCPATPYHATSASSRGTRTRPRWPDGHKYCSSSDNPLVLFGAVHC